MSNKKNYYFIQLHFSYLANIEVGLRAVWDQILMNLEFAQSVVRNPKLG